MISVVPAGADRSPASARRPRSPLLGVPDDVCLSEPGVTDHTTAVLYGANNNSFAAYAYWLLKYRRSQ
jgi:3-mercaptopyruvate sulfurtransferase SseA